MIPVNSPERSVNPYSTGYATSAETVNHRIASSGPTQRAGLT
jgi:hypothetical protein